MKFHIRSEHSLLLLLAFFLLAVLDPPRPHFAVRESRDAAGHSRISIHEGLESAAACQRTLLLSQPTEQTACPDCTPVAAYCTADLPASRRDWLSQQRLPLVSGRLRDGVVAYVGDTAVALAACETERAHLAGIDEAMRCYAPDTYRVRPALQREDASEMGSALFAGLAAALAAFAFCWWLVRYEHIHAHLSHDDTTGGPQKFHAVPTPRVGGLAVMIGLLLGHAVLAARASDTMGSLRSLLIIACLPAFFGGLIEDLTKSVGVLQRLLLTMASGALGAWLLAAVLQRLAIPGLDDLLRFYPLAIGITIVATAGLANALNIIDGYNGLASGSSVIVFLGLAGLAAQVGDIEIFKASLLAAGAVLGFLAWNWPGGKIFLGDGGAYLLGFLMAELSVLLVTRSPSLSPWCAMMLMAHPVTETLFSIYRRKLRRGHSPGKPDALHLHQLIYSRLVRVGGGQRTPEIKLARNSRVALYFWPMAALLAIVVQFYAWSSRYPVGFTALYALGYVVFYRRLVHWQSPKALILRR